MCQVLRPTVGPVHETAGTGKLINGALLSLFLMRRVSHCLSTYGRRAFAIAGSMTWNSLPTDLCRVENSTAAFGRLLTTHLFSEY